MSDSNDNDNNSNENSLTVLKAEKSVEKRGFIRQLHKLKGEKKWTILQEIVQDIHADYIIRDKIPTGKDLFNNLKEEIDRRYPESEDPEEKELRQLLINSTPSYISINAWLKIEGWDKAVYEKIKTTGLFSKERRTKMINALYERGLVRDTVAAKMYLTMSGDYSERPPDEKNQVADTFREINKILHKKG